MQLGKGKARSVQSSILTAPNMWRSVQKVQLEVPSFCHTPPVYLGIRFLLTSNLAPNLDTVVDRVELWLWLWWCGCGCGWV